MSIYQKVKEQINYDERMNELNSGIPSKTFFAYRSGEVKEFNTRSEALKFSTNIEEVTNKDKITEFRRKRAALENELEKLWKKQLQRVLLFQRKQPRS